MGGSAAQSEPRAEAERTPFPFGERSVSASPLRTHLPGSLALPHCPELPRRYSRRQVLAAAQHQCLRCPCTVQGNPQGAVTLHSPSQCPAHSLITAGLNKRGRDNVCFSPGLSGHVDTKQEGWQGSGEHVQDPRRREKLQFQATKNLLCFLEGGLGVGCLADRFRCPSWPTLYSTHFVH